MKLVKTLLSSKCANCEVLMLRSSDLPTPVFIRVAVPVPALDLLTYRVPDGCRRPSSARASSCRSARGS